MYLATVAAASMTLAACGDDDSGGGGSDDSSAATSTEPLVIAALEGPAATGDPDFTKGMRIAEARINAAGGVEGRKIEVRIFKKGLAPDSAVAAYRKAASDSEVIGAWGGASGVLAIAAQSDRFKLPFIAVPGRIDFVQPPKKYVFSASHDQAYPTSVLRWAVENKGVKKIAVLHYETDYSSGITDSLKARCQELGCEVVSEQKAALDASVDGLTPQLTNMRDSGADAYYIETLNPNGPKAARQLGMFDKPVISEQWLSVPAIAQATGKASEDIVFSAQKCVAPELIQDSDPEKKWCEDYRAQYEKAYPGEDYALFSAYGDDAVTIYAEAARALIKAGKEVTRDNIAAQLEQFDGESVRTSHGVLKEAKDIHRLTGEFQEAYFLYTIKYEGGKLTYTLAPESDPMGAQP